MMDEEEEFVAGKFISFSGIIIVNILHQASQLKDSKDKLLFMHIFLYLYILTTNFINETPLEYFIPFLSPLAVPYV